MSKHGPSHGTRDGLVVLVGGAVLVGAEDVEGAGVGLDVMVGIVEDAGDFVGEDAVGEAGDTDGEE
jgi:hypothetical protein